jgi:hypothetical protein
VVRVPLPDIGDLAIDISRENYPCIYVLVPVEHPSIEFLLRGFWLCDPARSVGNVLHFIGDGETRVGFLIALTKSRFRASSLTAALTQILGAVVRQQQR